MARNQFQENQRNQTMEAIIAATDEMKEKGLRLQLNTIAKKAGVSLGVMGNPEVKKMLYERYGIGRKVENLTDDVNALKREITRLREQLIECRYENRNLRARLQIAILDKDMTGQIL